MPRNMSRNDRIIRAFLATPLLIIVGLLIGPATALSIVLYVAAAVMVSTAAVGYCPLYSLLRIRTASRSSVNA